MTAEEYVKQELVAGRLTAPHIVELVSFWQKHHLLECVTADGKPGPKTRASLEDRMDYTKPPVARSTPTISSPMPLLKDGRKAVITSGFKAVNPSRPDHNGVDFFYPWKPGDKPDFIGDRGCAGKQANGDPKWGVPYGTCAIAADDGVIQLASNSPTGYRVWIDHGNGWRTGYFHLLGIGIWHIGDKIFKGDQVGLIGDSPRGSDGRHLHFELSPVDRYAPVDPAPYLK